MFLCRENTDEKLHKDVACRADNLDQKMLAFSLACLFVVLDFELTDIYLQL